MRNIFSIGRRRGAEDQLTEMLAYVWERHPDMIGGWLREAGLAPAPDGDWQVATQVTAPGSGRFDMTLTLPGEAYVVVESKLFAEFGEGQLARYLDHVGKAPEPLRAVITLTRSPPPDDPALLDEARARGVHLLHARWQELGRSIGDPAGEDVPDQFVQMLVEEGLVVPDALTTEDWTAWNRGAAVLARVKLLLEEARPAVQRISPGLRASARWGANERWIYSGYESERLGIGIGFSANEGADRPSSRPIIWVYVDRPGVAHEERRRLAAEACRTLPGARQIWSGVPYLQRPAEEVLAGGDFRQQIAAVAAFAHEVAVRFREVGYLPEDLALVEPAAQTA